MVEFLRYEDMKYAIKKLDDSRFRSHEVQFYINSKYLIVWLTDSTFQGEVSYVRVKEDSGDGTLIQEIEFCF